jgi:hypothetical protein
LSHSLSSSSSRNVHRAALAEPIAIDRRGLLVEYHSDRRPWTVTVKNYRTGPRLP